MAQLKLVVPALALGVAGAALAWAAGLGPTRAVPASSPARPVVAAATASPGRVPSPAAPALRPAAPAPAPSPVDEAALEEQGLRRLERYDAAYRAEPRDAAWAAPMEATIEQAFATGNYVGTRAIEMSCKTTFCRLEVEHDNLDAAEAFAVIVHDIPTSYAIKNLPVGAGGRSRTVGFFLRQERRHDNIVYREAHAAK